MEKQQCCYNLLLKTEVLFKIKIRVLILSNNSFHQVITLHPSPLYHLYSNHSRCWYSSSYFLESCGCSVSKGRQSLQKNQTVWTIKVNGNSVNYVICNGNSVSFGRQQNFVTYTQIRHKYLLHLVIDGRDKDWPQQPIKWRILGQLDRSFNGHGQYPLKF